ncbi:BA14K family protein [Rhizobium bangladeshense]|uniref:Lectin-like protein BA14k n=1 Tax=Rhizobium bangladeshense TaxID=1138189 RepID=A0ABS7LCD1_9HYPH|nr:MULTISPECIES: BA14K family protein [Rhizobium]MBX4866949.1 BA14K family protein [Rhizobium bangladeshense]MBX4874129.1 BA14K family protein [Rhizobium bangladeshense]MBX4883641.1 BA14K family protein [Rhizobium bangladeshense]MBX4888678.1 BA14K family protein [Rhizobium bangladeshense]MBX4919305.1 BA14K family protein [Rhizobium bangladeshense]
MRKLSVAALCLIIGASGITPAQAFPAINPPRIEAQQQIEHVRWRGRGGHRRGAEWGWALGGLAVGTIIGGALAQPYYGSPYRYYGSPYRYYGSPYRYYGSPYRYYDPPYRYYGSPYRYGPPYRDYGRYYAPPYRNYASSGYYGGRRSHVSWCYARYRSYRAFDNTFQPYYGPRRQCISPY